MSPARYVRGPSGFVELGGGTGGGVAFPPSSIDELVLFSAWNSGGQVINTLTSGDPAHTKGAWVELVASTAADYHFVGITIDQTATSAQLSNALVDLAVGAVGAEVVVVPDLAMGGSQNLSYAGDVTQKAFMPLAIPAGSRVAARIQSFAAASPSRITLAAFSAPGMNSPSSVLNLSGNGAVDSEALPNPSNLVFQEVVASCPVALQGLVVTAQPNTNNTGFTDFRASIGIGASGAEVEHFLPWAWRVQNAEYLFTRSFAGPHVGYYPIAIPAGERISIRKIGGANGEAQFGVMGVPA